MFFKLLRISTLLLMLLSGMAVAECNGKDKSWSDIGDDTTIEAAFKQVCVDQMAVDCEIGSMIAGCVNVENNHIEARIEIAMQPENGTTDVKLVDLVCEKLLDQVKTGCPKKGGSLWAEASLGSEGHEYNYIHGRISAYPKKNSCPDKA